MILDRERRRGTWRKRRLRVVAGTAYATFVIAFQLVDDGGALRREGVPLRGTLISVAQSLALRLLLLEPLKFGLMALLPQRLFERAAHSR